MIEESILNSGENDTEEKKFDLTLRPRNLKEYIGQKQVKESLSIFICAAKGRKESLEHVLIYGPPGLGKTTLANVIASELGVNFRATSGPAIERAGDLASILTNLSDHDILFIDEIHRLNRTVEEVLYPAMEDYALDLIIGKGPSAKTLRIDLPHFTLIGATTRIGMISSPMRDRFGMVHHLDFYSEGEIIEIINRSAKILKVKTHFDGSREIGMRARGTPRVANRLLKRVRDFAQVNRESEITKEIACKALDILEVDSIGLDKIDRKLLFTIIDKFQGGPVGLGTLSAAISEDKDTIEEVYEPFLIQIGLLARTAKGRIATDHAFRHLGRSNPKNGGLI